MRGELPVEEKEIACPICDSITEYRRKEKFWVCPTCNTEVWPDEMKLKEVSRLDKAAKDAELFRQQLRWRVGGSLAKDPLPCVAVINPKKSSSKVGRRRKKKPKQEGKYWLPE